MVAQCDDAPNHTARPEPAKNLLAHHVQHHLRATVEMNVLRC